MATLNVTNLQNVASTVTNVSLLADGTTTLVLNSTGTARTGGIRYNAGNLEVYTSGGVWAPIGGGGGGVSSVTASAPLVSSGGATPNVTATLATAAQAAAGTSNVVLSTPEFSVPKDASGMTGAALLPTGTNLQRAAIATPVAGMTRFNTDVGYTEVYTGAAEGWKNLAWLTPALQTTDLTYSANTTLSNGVYLCRNLTVNAGVTLTIGNQVVVFLCTGNATINGNITATQGPSGGAGAGLGTIDKLSTAIPGAGPGSGLNTTSPYPPAVSLTGSGGASGYAATGSTVGSAIEPSPGGQGGGGVLIKAFGSITQGASSTISVKGGNAGFPANGANDFFASGGGGGSGGSITFNAGGPLTVSGTLDVRGGNGMNGFNSGGLIGASGGGGGGGGSIILQCLGPLTDTSTKLLTGGAAGTASGVPNVNGAPKGADGGGAGGLENTAGSPGVVLYYGSPF